MENAKNPTLSVVIPTYNRSELLKETIQSVLNQTFKGYELLVVDDGSSDDTEKVVKEFNDPRVKYLYKENGGQSSARNLGIYHSKGEWIAFLDHDDLWHKDYLKRMFKHITNLDDEIKVIYTQVKGLLKNKQLIPYAKKHRYKGGWITKCFFEGGPCIMPSATIIRKKTLKQFYFDEALRTGEDNDLFLRMSVKTPFYFVEDNYAIKRVLPDSQANNITPETICNGILSVERFIYQLGGNKIISPFKYRKKLSHKYRRAAKLICRQKNKTMTQKFLKRAISYYPLDLRLYPQLLKTLILMKKREDQFPDWQFPPPLPEKPKVSF